MPRAAPVPRAALLFAAILLASSARAQDQGGSPNAWDARVVQAQGDVEVYPAGSPNAVSASAGMPLSQGDRVTTGDGANAEIGFDGLHIVSLNPDTDLTLRSDERSATVLAVNSGGILAKIQPLLSGQALSVQTPDAVAAVRGTQFGVDMSASGQTSVGVFDEGRVAVQGAAGGPPEMITAHQETSVAPGERPIRPHPLRHFLRDQARMRRLIRKERAMRRNWRAMSPETRRAWRGRMARRARSNQERNRRTQLHLRRTESNLRRRYEPRRALRRGNRRDFRPRRPRRR